MEQYFITLRNVGIKFIICEQHHKNHSLQLALTSALSWKGFGPSVFHVFCFIIVYVSEKNLLHTWLSQQPMFHDPLYAEEHKRTHRDLPFLSQFNSEQLYFPYVKISKSPYTTEKIRIICACIVDCVTLQRVFKTLIQVLLLVLGLI